MSYYWSGNNLQHGSTGRDVEQWQTYLKNEGYFNGKIDGIYGDVTTAATKAYQAAKGIGQDGIAGPKTMAAAGFLNYNTPTAMTPYTEHDTTGYDEYNNGVDKAARDDAIANLNSYGAANWDKQTEYDTKYEEYRDRKPFSYDFNADALYQQYKDRYMQQGQMAMQDAMGQAAAMTGGYGNSYAASVGNQAYQQSLQQLNDVIPELYQLAYDKHKQEGQDMLNVLGLLEKDRDMYMEDWQRGYDRLNDKYNLANSTYKDNASMYYTDLANKNTASDQAFNAALSIYDREEAQRLDALDRAANDSAYQVVTGSDGKPKIVDKAGNPVETENDVPDYVYTKAESFESNVALGNYLDGLEATGVISPEQADAIYAQYVDDNEKFIKDEAGNATTNHSYRDMITSTKGWEVDNDGGTNWFWGVDNNAIVVAPNGEKIRLDNLVDKLVSEGMSKAKAKDYVKKLQKNLGI